MKHVLGMICAAGLAWAPPALAQDIQLTVAQARAIAHAALANGDLKTAVLVSEAVVTERPEDAQTRVILAASLIRAGHMKAGGAEARRAFGSAGGNRPLKHEAARLAALAASQQGRQGVAKFWLRRASDFASEQQEAQLRRDFDAVDRRDKWERAFSFTLAPSSNINGGAESDVLEIDGVPSIGVLSGDAQALSGYRASVSARLGYQLAGSARSRTAISGQYYGTFHKLTDEAQALAPTATGSDFNYSIVALDLTHVMLPEGAKGPYSFGLGTAKRWYGGDELAHSASLSLGKAWRLGDGQSFLGQLRYTREWSDSDRALDAHQYALSGRYGARLGNGGRFQTGLTVTTSNSDGRSLDYTGQQLTLRYTTPDPLGAVHPTFGLDLGHKFYPDHVAGLTVVPGGRRDTSIGLTVDLVVSGAQMMGFAPVVTLRAATTDSNVSRYETTDLSAGLSIRSSF